jgi:hypothetical protein
MHDGLSQTLTDAIQRHGKPGRRGAERLQRTGPGRQGETDGVPELVVTRVR